MNIFQKERKKRPQQKKKKDGATTKGGGKTKTVKMNGFRNGSVPVNVIKKKFGKQAYREVVNELLESSVKDALKNNDLKPVAMPSVDEVQDSPNEDLKFTLNLEVFPNLNLNNY